MDRLYTILLEYRGGSFPYQVKASSEYSALKKCMHIVDVSEIDYLGPKKYKELIEVVNNPKLQKMDNLVNIWQWFGIIYGESITAYIVLMQSTETK